VRDGKLVGARSRDVNKVSFLIQPSIGPRPLFRREPVAHVRPGHAVGGRWERGAADDAQVCNCNGVTRRHRAALAAGNRTVSRSWRRRGPGMGCGACRELVARSSTGRARGAWGGPLANYYVPSVPLTKPALIDGTRAGLSRSRVVEALAGGVGGRRSRWAWPHCSECCGGRVRGRAQTPASSTIGSTPISRRRYVLRRPRIAVGHVVHQRGRSPMSPMATGPMISYRRPAHRPARHRKEDSRGSGGTWHAPG